MVTCKAQKSLTLKSKKIEMPMLRCTSHKSFSININLGFFTYNIYDIDVYTVKFNKITFYKKL
jgi:hypothetical protein